MKRSYIQKKKVLEIKQYGENNIHLINKKDIKKDYTCTVHIKGKCYI